MQPQSNGPVPAGHMASEAAWESTHPSVAASRVCTKIWPCYAMLRSPLYDFTCSTCHFQGACIAQKSS